MSGGRYDYFHCKLESVAWEIRDEPGCNSDGRSSVPLRRAFKAHLAKVAAALHAIEWNDSGDGNNKEGELIRACIEPAAELEQAVKHATEAATYLDKAILKAEGLLEKAK